MGRIANVNFGLRVFVQLVLHSRQTRMSCLLLLVSGITAFCGSAGAQIQIPLDTPVNRPESPKPAPVLDKVLPPTGGQQEVRLAEGILFVRIPAGEFVMGSPGSEVSRADDESPLSPVVISNSFWIGKYEVSQREWAAVMENNPSQSPSGEDHPVENVSWEDCQWFIGELNAKSTFRFRLPTEAEWEYTCRAGSGTSYCTGDDTSALEKCGWYDGNSGGGHHPVGEKEPNVWGLYDMHGNVYEWCQDYYREDYRGRDGSGAAWDRRDANANRVRRGGSYQQPAKNCRSAFRGTGKPESRRADVGLRLVMEE